MSDISMAHPQWVRAIALHIWETETALHAARVKLRAALSRQDIGELVLFGGQTEQGLSASLAAIDKALQDVRAVDAWLDTVKHLPASPLR